MIFHYSMTFHGIMEKSVSATATPTAKVKDRWGFNNSLHRSQCSGSVSPLRRLMSAAVMSFYSWMADNRLRTLREAGYSLMEIRHTSVSVPFEECSLLLIWLLMSRSHWFSFSFLFCPMIVRSEVDTPAEHLITYSIITQGNSSLCSQAASVLLAMDSSAWWTLFSTSTASHNICRCCRSMLSISCSTTCQRSSTGFTSGDCGGHWRTLACS